MDDVIALVHTGKTGVTCPNPPPVDELSDVVVRVEQDRGLGNLSTPGIEVESMQPDGVGRADAEVEFGGSVCPGVPAVADVSAVKAEIIWPMVST